MKVYEIMRPLLIVALSVLFTFLGLFPETGKADDLKPQDVLPLVVSVKDMPGDYTSNRPMTISGSTNSAELQFFNGATKGNIRVEISRSKTSVAFLESKMGSIVKYHTEDADMVFSRNLGLGERSFHRGSESIIQPNSDAKYVSQDIRIFWQEWRISVSITHYFRVGQTIKQDFTDHEAGQLLRSLASKIYPRFLKVVSGDKPPLYDDSDFWEECESLSMVPSNLIGVTGEVFILRGGGTEWKPAKNNMGIFEGDRLRTGLDGQAEIRFAGSDSMRLAPRTYLHMPCRSKVKKGVLERGAIYIWEKIKKVARNEPFEIKAGHSISGRKGTEYVIEVDENTQIATYTVNEGSVEVRLNGKPSTKRELKAGDSAQVTQRIIRDHAFEWTSLLKKYDWVERNQKESAVNAAVKRQPDHSDPDQEICTQYFPGTFPTGKNAEGRLVCECRDGVIWDEVSKSCPQKTTQATENQSSGLGILPLFVTKAMSAHAAGPGGSEYDKVSASVFIDPSTTQWVAWNNTPDVSKTDHTLTGTFLWGGGAFGTDDFIRLTVTAPNGQSASVDMDKNNSYGAHRQGDAMNVIFNHKGQAPQTLRIDAFGDTAGQRVVFEEAGAFNQLFEKPGIYTFDFSFRNQFTADAGHGDVYLLISSW